MVTERSIDSTDPARPSLHLPEFSRCVTPMPSAADRYLNFLDHAARISWRTCVAHQTIRSQPEETDREQPHAHQSPLSQEVVPLTGQGACLLASQPQLPAKRPVGDCRPEHQRKVGSGFRSSGRLSCACGRIDGKVQDLSGRDVLVVKERPDVPGYVTWVAQ